MDANLACPSCGSKFTPVFEYSGYYQHRELTGYECEDDDGDCGAEWDRNGTLTSPPRKPRWGI